MKLAEDLKKAVLQAAMQGKLTNQLKTDSSVDELLKKIADEKAKLIEEGKIKKATTKASVSGRAHAEITEEEIPFDIPENWIWERIGNIFIHAAGKALNQLKEKEGNLLPYITTSNLYWDCFKLDDLKQMYFLDSELEKCTAKKGDLLVCEGGDVGRSAIWDKDYNICLQNHIHKLRPYSAEIKVRFYFYYLMLLKLTGEVKGKGIGLKGLSANALNTMLIPLPPIEEQQRIVEKLNQILPLIDEYGKEEDELIALCQKFPEEMKKSVLQSAIQGKLTEQLETDSSVDELLKKIAEEKDRRIKNEGLKREKALPQITSDELPFDLPEGWKAIYINDFAFVTKLAGFEYSEYIAPNLKTSGIPLFKGKNVQHGQLVLDFESYIPENISNNLSRSQLLRKCLLTPYVGTIGNIAIFDGSFKAHLGSNVGKIEIFNSDTEKFILEEYLLYYLRSDFGYKELIKYKKATAQESISIDAIRNVIVPLPPIEEQQRIVEKLNTILPIIDSMAVYGTKKKVGRPKQEEALAFISSLLGTQKSSDSKPVSPEILELTAKAKEELPAIVKKYASLMGVTYNRITIRHQKTRWGSCTKTGNLSFNCLLMKMPENVRDYVIIHELAHRKELNHSTKFWAIVAEYCSWYKDAKLWLKDNGENLFLL